MEWLKDERLWNELTPRELTFFKQDRNPKKEVIWMTWLVEAQVAVLWSIGKLNALPQPTVKCDTGLVIAAMPDLGESTSPFVCFFEQLSDQLRKRLLPTTGRSTDRAQTLASKSSVTSLALGQG